MPKRQRERTCFAPDRHVPGLRCGYPLPCPHHTLVIKAGSLARALDRVARVRDAFAPRRLR